MTVKAITRSTCDRCGLSVEVPPDWWGRIEANDGYGRTEKYDMCTKCMPAFCSFMIAPAEVE